MDFSLHLSMGMSYWCVMAMANMCGLKGILSIKIKLILNANLNKTIKVVLLWHFREKRPYTENEKKKTNIIIVLDIFTKRVLTLGMRRKDEKHFRALPLRPMHTDTKDLKPGHKTDKVDLFDWPLIIFF